MDTPHLSGPKEIYDAATAKLEEAQFEIESRKHDLQSAYFDLRRMLGTEEADRFVDGLQALPW